MSRGEKRRAYWILHAANWCHAEGMNDAEAVEFIRERMTRQPSPHNEVEGAVAKIYDEPERERGEPYVNASSVPKFDPERRAAVITHYPRAYRQIATSSPLIFTGAAAETEFVIDRLFPGNPLICCAKAQHSSITRSREMAGHQTFHAPVHRAECDVCADRHKSKARGIKPQSG